MPIDPSIIAQGIKPLQINDPLEQYSNMQRAQYLGTQNQLAQQEIARTNALNTVLADPNSMNADNTLNMPYIQAHIGQGGGSALPGLAKNAMEMRAQLASTQKTQADTTTARLATGLNQIAHIDPVNDPNALQKIIGIHNALAPDLKSVGVDADGENQRASNLFALSVGWDRKTQGPSPADTYIATQGLTGKEMAQMERPTTADIGGNTVMTQAHSFATGAPLQTLAVYTNTPHPDALVAARQSNINNLRTIGQSAANASLASRTTLAGIGMTTTAAQRRELAKQANGELMKYLPTAQGATPLIAGLNESLSLLNNPKIITGPGSEFRLQLAKIADMAGIKDTGSTDTQVLVKQLTQQLASTAGVFGAEGARFRQMAGPEINLLKNGTPTQTNTTEALRTLLNFAKKSVAFGNNLYIGTRNAYAQKIPEALLLPPKMNPVPDGIMPQDLSISPAAMNHIQSISNPDAPDPADPGHTLRQNFDTVFSPGATARLRGEKQ